MPSGAFRLFAEHVLKGICPDAQAVDVSGGGHHVLVTHDGLDGGHVLALICQYGGPQVPNAAAGSKAVAEFTSGALDQGPPPISRAGAAGATARAAYDWYKEKCER